MILLTATLPPSMEQGLWKAIFWEAADVKLFRCPLGRPNIRYSVTILDDGDSNLEAAKIAIFVASAFQSVG